MSSQTQNSAIPTLDIRRFTDPQSPEDRQAFVDELGAAYREGREAAGAEPATPPDDLLREAAETIAFPLRDRIASAIDDVDDGDTSGLVERIGARYREWKNQQLERALAPA